MGGGLPEDTGHLGWWGDGHQLTSVWGGFLPLPSAFHWHPAQHGDAPISMHCPLALCAGGPLASSVLIHLFPAQGLCPLFSPMAFSCSSGLCYFFPDAFTCTKNHLLSLPSLPPPKNKPYANSLCCAGFQLRRWPSASQGQWPAGMNRQL
jgi:hypothetical protein